MKSGAMKKAIGLLVLLLTAAAALVTVFAVQSGKNKPSYDIANVSAAMPNPVKPTQQTVCGIKIADGTACGKNCYSINSLEEFAYVVTESGGGG